MKSFKLTMVAALLGLTLPAQATLFTQGTGAGSGTDLGSVVNGSITDGSPIGTVNTMDLTGQGLGNISDLQVTLNISGGYNGDLYGYLSYNGQMVVLLNRIGVGSGNAFGNNTSGLTVTFSDGASGNIHDQTGALGSSYQVDGRAISPLGGPGTFDASPTGSTLSGFNGMNGGGTWTLFLADVSGGGGPATLLGWGLDISAVPEPATWALGIFGLLAGSTVVVRRWRTV